MEEHRELHDWLEAIMLYVIGGPRFRDGSRRRTATSSGCHPGGETSLSSVSCLPDFTRLTMCESGAEKIRGCSVRPETASAHFAFGDADVYIICDIPDVASAAAISLAVNASGAVDLKTVPLLSVEEIDLAAKKQVVYSAPGTA